MTSRNEILTHEQKIINKLTERINFLNKKSNSLSYYRLITIIGGVALAFISFNYIDSLIAWIVIVLDLALFAVLAARQSKVIASIDRTKKWIMIKSVRIAKMNLNWDKIPEAKKEYRDSHHPFEIDLDITGQYSLLRILNNTFSKEGYVKLKLWLLNPLKHFEELAFRQSIVRELIPFRSFREKLFLRFSYLKQNEFEGTQLVQWLEKDSTVKISNLVLFFYSFISVFNILFFILNYYEVVPSYWVAGYLLVLIIYGLQEKKIKLIIGPSEIIFDEYLKAYKVFEVISKTDFHGNTELEKFLEPFHNKETNPVTFSKKINRLINLLSFRENAIFRFLANSIIPYDVFLSNQLARQKEVLKQVLPTWLEKLYEFEALNSLAEYGYTNPGFTFPEIHKKNSSKLEIKKLGHPLLPYDKRVSNDFSITANEIIIITGSNMSGKSTFLKTLGVNFVLAFCGAPVCAENFSTTIFRIFTCIKINDNLNEGLSYFYSEVQRLKVIYDNIQVTNEPPLFFLVDEIFKGTNNRERLIGSREYIKSLIGKNGCGAISTHDLELVNLGKEFDSISNKHFKEEIIENRMVFDYKLYFGPCPTTNALRIMKLGGLNIEI
jgi:ABC-type multidrug transport system fused ATPase/permease subunit